MIATAELPGVVTTTTPAATLGEGARALADGYLRYACATWRGDAGAPIFGIRLGAYWRSQLPPAPAGAPEAFSPHGAGGRGIAWRQVEGEVVGSVAGCRGGYVVPVAAIPRLLRTVPPHPYQAPGTGS